ncbi:tautomerase family protein [Burkholderia multivorans]|uniref:Tautomerase family protein n=1 Tax=Burkholderia multivorans TaxID=87883 RepID=A0AB37ASP6_9BURK|nr:tautomerase family protein [Burkholderia multivorans]PRE43827.1 tautomerase family protein [Burkholderia multivorans]PRE54628.1 tautomerase family protein [Burkholderia multivorans]
MPFTRIAVREGKPAAYRAALVDGVHRALMHTFNVPEDDIERSDDLVMIQITANNTRTLEQKRALYRTIAENLAAQPGVRPQDVFVSLVEVLKEDWSFGNGIAQYAV